jgi:hypothetical protein
VKAWTAGRVVGSTAGVGVDLADDFVFLPFVDLAILI